MSRFLLLSASMGAGHDAACAELARRLNAAGHESVELDVLRLLPGPIGAGLRGFYHLVIRRAPFVYSGIYSAFFQPGDGPRPGSTPLAALAEGRLLDAVAHSRADAVVSLFHLAAQLTGRARARGRLAVPSAALVTDFAVHRQWLQPGNDLNLCLTGPAAQEARHALGRPSAVYGPLVPESFHPHPPGEQRWHERFAEGGRSGQSGGAGGSGGMGGTGTGTGTGTGRPMVVLSAGAWGAGTRFTRTAETLRHAGYHPIVLCGRDERLRRRLTHVKGATALGWVEDMPGLLAASAALLDNAAGQTALQALAVGIPVIGWRPIPGHGIAGVRRMAELGLSDYAANEAELVQALDRLVPDGPRRSNRIAAGRALLEPDVVAPLEAMVAER
ncbi:hypothetical protein KDL01_28045 [Actinospica durhamensis]|uniref:Diacylglycerol glucosyltransferase N-terminal domain-containing protein n=1 Tax=Actinospica durhamensis TaxID=1508375 RepID=A0A941IVG5_9ACTN|nr:hypothetical protein [Actinospica durhamensis]MBR7837161.1 hypothetical protein [Actinospica durhamensis]